MADLEARLAELAQWADENAVPVEPVAYGDHPDQVVDWRGDGPVVAVFHGGFWRPVWDRTTTIPLAIALARSGWRTANIEYRRRAGRWQEMLDDVRAAAALVQPDVAVGHSAGGHSPSGLPMSLRSRSPASAMSRWVRGCGSGTAR